MSLKRIY